MSLNAKIIQHVVHFSIVIYNTVYVIVKNGQFN